MGCVRMGGMGLCEDGCHGLHHGSRVRRGALLCCTTLDICAMRC